MNGWPAGPASGTEERQPDGDGATATGEATSERHE
jgi:hypothetical protein